MGLEEAGQRVVVQSPDSEGRQVSRPWCCHSAGLASSASSENESSNSDMSLEC